MKTKEHSIPPDKRTVTNIGELHKELQEVVKLVEKPESNTGQVPRSIFIQDLDKLGQTKSEDLLDKFVIDFVLVFHNLANFPPDRAHHAGRVLHTTYDWRLAEAE